jgi:hypothetical protein
MDIGFAGAGHGTNVPSWILFPFSWLIFTDGLAHSNFVLLARQIWQFPIYGIILGFANVKRKLILAACVLLSVHLSAVGWIFGSHYYALYKYKHDPNNHLEEAVRNNDVETARILLDQGIDPNYHRQTTSTSLLFLACMDGHKDMAKLLLEKGADINYVNPLDGKTALFVAVVFHHEEIIQLLLSKGADLTIKDRDGFTILERANQWRESKLKQTKPQLEYKAEDRARDERIISLLESATKAEKKP